MEHFSEVVKILTDLSGVKSIRAEHALGADLGLDSLRMVTLLLLLEDTFGIRLEESDMNPFDLITVSDVVNLVEKYTGGDDDGTSEKEA